MLDILNKETDTKTLCWVLTFITHGIVRDAAMDCKIIAGSHATFAVELLRPLSAGCTFKVWGVVFGTIHY